MSSNPHHLPVTAEDRRKHLDYVQAVIARLSQSSSTAKGWTLTLAGAAFGFSALNETWYLTLLGLAVITSFSVLDAHYLHEERLFRRLYQAVVDGRVPPYSMRKDDCRTPEDTKLKAYASWSVLGFYSPLTLAGVVTMGIALATA